jgi:hypothetical protein
MPDDGSKIAQDNASMSEITQADQAQTNMALALPAVYINGVSMSATPSGIRISFMEGMPGCEVPLPRSNVLMDFQTALGLRDLLNRHLHTAKNVGN